jgi:hypothetical protein
MSGSTMLTTGEYPFSKKYMTPSALVALERCAVSGGRVLLTLFPITRVATETRIAEMIGLKVDVELIGLSVPCYWNKKSL